MLLSLSSISLNQMRREASNISQFFKLWFGFWGKENLRENILSKKQKSPRLNMNHIKIQSIKRILFILKNYKLHMHCMLMILKFAIRSEHQERSKRLQLYTGCLVTFHTHPDPLSALYTWLLCKAADINRFDYDEVLAPLLKDIAEHSLLYCSV